VLILDGNGPSAGKELEMHLLSMQNQERLHQSIASEKSSRLDELHESKGNRISCLLPTSPNSTLTTFAAIGKRTRKVRFVDNNEDFPEHSSPVTEVYPPSPLHLSDGDVQALWFDSEELLDIKNRAKTTCLRVSQIEDDESDASASSKKEEKDHFTLAHRKTTLILAADFRGLLKLSQSSPVEDLIPWCSSRLECRGLERFACRDYNLFRQKDIRTTRRGVLNWQKENLLDHPPNNSCSAVDSLANIARKASRRARTFAHFLGEADALEAARIYSCTDCSSTTRKRNSGCGVSTIKLNEEAKCDFIRSTPARKRSRNIDIGLAAAVATGCNI
jgi:hypothetical protein